MIHALNLALETGYFRIVNAFALVELMMMDLIINVNNVIIVGLKLLNK